MKNLFYLPVLAVVCLSGCKGHSFLNQRYTHFKHSASMPTKEMTAAHANFPNLKRQVPNENVSQNKNTVSPEILENHKFTQINSEKPKAQATQEKNLRPLISFKSIDVVDEKITKEVSSQKIVKEKSTVTKAIIGTLFKIVLFVVILVVVLAIILLVIIL